MPGGSLISMTSRVVAIAKMPSQRTRSRSAPGAFSRAGFSVLVFATMGGSFCGTFACAGCFTDSFSTESMHTLLKEGFRRDFSDYSIDAQKGVSVFYAHKCQVMVKKKRDGTACKATARVARTRRRWDKRVLCAARVRPEL